MQLPDLKVGRLRRGVDTQGMVIRRKEIQEQYIEFGREPNQASQGIGIFNGL